MAKEEYKQYLQSRHWKELRKVKKNKKNICGICRATQNLDVHHLFYKQLYNCDTTDLRVLCRRCHFLAHNLFKQGKFRFKASGSHHHRWAVLKHAVSTELGLNSSFIDTSKRRAENKKKKDKRRELYIGKKDLKRIRNKNKVITKKGENK